MSPEIDALRARVELRTAEQRVIDATNDLEKDKLTLDRVTGIPLAQSVDSEARVWLYVPLPNPDDPGTEEAEPVASTLPAQSRKCWPRSSV